MFYLVQKNNLSFLSKSNTWVLFTLLVFITLHLKLFSFSDFQVSLGYILIPIWFYSTFRAIGIKFFKMELFLLFIIYLIPFLPLNISNWNDFLKTYSQYVLSFYFVIRSYGKIVLVDKNTIDKALKLFQIILLITVLFQFITLNLLNIIEYYNIFGDNQLYYSLAPHLGKGRMKAFYLEPSYLGLIVVNIYWTRSYLQRKKEVITFNSLITICVLIFTQSALAYLMFIILIIFEIKRNYFARIKPLFYLLIISIIPIFYQLSFTFLRFNEFNADNTSGFFRFILPLQVLQENISNQHYFGLTFGQLEQVSERIFDDFGAKSAMGNSFFLILGYFGLIGLFVFVFLILKYIKSDSQVIKSFIILTFLNLNNSGAFMTLQYVFIAFLIPFLAIKYNENKTINYYSSQKR